MGRFGLFDGIVMSGNKNLTGNSNKIQSVGTGKDDIEFSVFFASGATNGVSKLTIGNILNDYYKNIESFDPTATVPIGNCDYMMVSGKMVVAPTTATTSVALGTANDAIGTTPVLANLAIALPVPVGATAFIGDVVGLGLPVSTSQTIWAAVKDKHFLVNLDNATPTAAEMKVRIRFCYALVDIIVVGAL
jgi:hypothetical protein